MRIRGWTAAMTFVGLGLSLGCVSSEELQRVERELGDLKLEVFKLRREMEDANRRAEADRAMASEARALDRRFQADLQESLRQLQETTRVLGNRLGTLVNPSRPSRPAPSSGEESGPVSEEDKAFNAALLDYNRGRYDLASEGFELFLKAHPNTARRPDALFFMGLCHYNQKQYEKALEYFDRLVKEHANSSQYLPAKLKRAQALLRMGLKPAATKAFRELTEGFPGTPEARTAEQELTDLKGP